MWTINIFFFVAVFLAIRQGDWVAILLIVPAYWYLLNLITDMEDTNGTDYTTESTRSYSRYPDPGLLDGANDHMGTAETGSRNSPQE